MTAKPKFQQFNRYLINLQFAFLPVFRFYNARIRWLASAGIKAGIGAKVNGHTQFYGDGELEIGENTWIGPGCRFYTNADAPIIIGANCDIAPEVAFVTGSHEMGDEVRRAGTGTAKSIMIGDGCWIGARVTILGGTHIGRSCILAAGAVVTEDVPDNSLVGGVPARVIKSLAVK